MIMTNRLTPEEPEERARAPDYWGVRTTSCYYFVSQDTAVQLLAQLRRFWRPRWLVFVDLSGSRIAVPSRSVEMIGECTAGQRAVDRALMKALSQEGEEDTRPW